MTSTHQSLEHRSSLRRMPFPGCCTEALERLRHHSVTFAKKQPSPKEIEVVLDAIDEFIFGASGAGSASPASSKGHRDRISNPGPASLTELQMLQILIQFFSGKDESENAQDSVHSTMFIYLFMEPIGKKSSQSKTNRILVMGKLLSLGLALNCKNLLHCASIWMHQEGQTSDRVLELANLLINENLLLLPQQEMESPMMKNLMSVPGYAPLFVANFLTAAAELYYTDDEVFKAPPALLVKLINEWLIKYPMLAFTSVMNATQDCLPPGSAASASQTPHMGLAKWTIIAALMKQEPVDLFSKLHVTLLSSFCEAQLKRQELKSEVIPVKRLISLIQKIAKAMKSAKSESQVDTEKALDRLGQTLQAVSASDCLSGKSVEIITSLSSLPSNKLIQMFVVNFAQV